MQGYSLLDIIFTPPNFLLRVAFLFLSTRNSYKTVRYFPHSAFLFLSIIMAGSQANPQPDLAMSKPQSSSRQEGFRQVLLEMINDHDKNALVKQTPVPSVSSKASATTKYKSPVIKKSGTRSTPSTVSNTYSILKLPNELLEVIISHFKGSQLLSLRLMCRRLAHLCAPHLFNEGFTIKPHREDMIRLARVCLVPEIARGIKYIEIYMGDMNKHHLMGAIQGIQIQSRSMPVEMLKRLFDPNTLHCNQKLLEACFSQLPNLIDVETESGDSPFLDDDWYTKPKDETMSNTMFVNDAWEWMQDNPSNFDRTHCFNTRTGSIRYASVIAATIQMPFPLTRLVLNALPLDIFAKDYSFMEIDLDFNDNPAAIEVNTDRLELFKRAVGGLKDLDITLIGSGRIDTIYTGAKLARAITGFLGAMDSLQSLAVNWEVDEDFDVDFATAFDESLVKLQFKNLENLRLSTTESSRAVLLAFILRQASTLKRLEWGADFSGTGNQEHWQSSHSPDEDMERQTWREVLTELRTKMTNLIICEVSDHDLEGGYGALYDIDWTPITYEYRHKVSPTKLLELYVLGKMPWPMRKDDPHPYKGWQCKHTTTQEDFATYTPEVLADIYSEDWETDREDGADSSDSDDEEEESDDMDDVSDDYDEDGADEFYDQMDEFDGFDELQHVMGDHFAGHFSMGMGMDVDGWESDTDEPGDTDDDMPMLLDESHPPPQNPDTDHIMNMNLASSARGWGMKVQELHDALGYIVDENEL